MNDKQKSTVLALRGNGLSCMKIAKQLGISENTVKSFFRRNCENSSVLDAQTANGKHCLLCRKPLSRKNGGRPRKFCSDACRAGWWNSHLDRVNRKAVYTFLCENCGEAFSAYGNANRRYCSRACYIAGRFGKGRVHE